MHSQSIDVGSALALAEPTVKRLARRLLSRQHREDAEQQARLKLIERLPRFDPSRGDFGAFAYRVVRNAILDMRRSLRVSHRRAGALPEDVRGGATWGGADDRVRAKLLESPDALLTPKQSELLRLTFRFDSRDELAAHLGVPIDRANERVCRLRCAVRKLVA